MNDRLKKWFLGLLLVMAAIAASGIVFALLVELAL